MPSYQAFLPKSGGGGSDTVGSITRMSTVMDALVEIDGKTYMKEGYHLSESADTFPEAYEKLSGKDGKQWEGIIDLSLTTSDIFRGMFTTEIGIVAVFTSTNQTLKLYKVDPERNSINILHTYTTTATNFRSNAVYQNGCIWIWMDSNYLVSVKPTDLGAKNETYVKPSGMNYTFGSKGFPVGDKGIIWSAVSPGYSVVYTEVERSAVPTSGGSHYFVFPTSLLQGSIQGGIQFTEIGGNVVTFIYTGSGEIAWHGGSGNLYEPANWSPRVTVKNLQDMGLYGVFQPKFIVASPLADVVYLGDSNGAYFVTNGRGLGPEGALYNVEYSKFPALVSSGTSWSCVDGTIFFNPGAAFGNYYRFTVTGRKWESFNYPNKIRLLGDLEAANSVTKSGTTMVHWSDVSALVSGRRGVMVSADKVTLPIDNTTEGGTSAYMRVK